MQERKRIGVIFGGRSGEHDVSLNSARSILAALNREKYDVVQIGITQEGRWLAGRDPADPSVLEAFVTGETAHLTPVGMLPDPDWVGLNRTDRSHFERFAELDVIFPVLHGTYGEDGTLQGLLEICDAAYVGAGVVGAAVGMDKGIFKDVMSAHGIPVVDWKVYLRSEVRKNLESIAADAMKIAPFPLFVKPANLGSSVGVSKCCSQSDLLEGLMEAACYDRRILVERGLNAREIEVSVLGNDDLRVSLPGEVVPSRDFYTYEAKYLDNLSGLLLPAPLDESMTARVQELAMRAYKATDGAGMARVDFLLDKESGELFLSELNTIPGFTQISMYPKLWEISGIPYTELVDRLVLLALERKADRAETRYKRE